MASELGLGYQISAKGINQEGCQGVWFFKHIGGRVGWTCEGRGWPFRFVGCFGFDDIQHCCFGLDRIPASGDRTKACLGPAHVWKCGARVCFMLLTG